MEEPAFRPARPLVMWFPSGGSKLAVEEAVLSMAAHDGGSVIAKPIACLAASLMVATAFALPRHLTRETAARAAQPAGPPPGIGRVQLVDNASVLVARLTFQPRARETVHTHPFSAVVIQLTPGEVEMQLGPGMTRETRIRGFAWYIARETSHAAGNVGTAAFDMVTVALKADRLRPVAGAPNPSWPIPAGIKRTPRIENDETRVVEVAVEPGAREPVHTHPFDLVVVQLTAGTVEVRLAADAKTVALGAGEVVFLPRDVPHAIGNAGRGPLAMMSVAIF